MKKFVSILLVLCLACLLIPAVADDSVAGVWKLNRIVAGDQELNSDTLAMLQAEMILDLREDGTFTDRESIGEDVTEYAGTWSVNADQTITLFPEEEGASPSVIVLQGDELLVDTGASQIYLIRDTGTAEAPKTVIPESISQFDGEYVVTGVSVMGMSLTLPDLGMDTNVVLTVQEGSGHLVSTYTNGYVWEEDVTTEFRDGKLVTSPITMGANMGNLTMEISLQDDGSLFAVTKIPISGMELEATFVLTPADQVEQEPAA